MKRTGKIFLGFVIVVVLAVAAGLWYVGANLDSMVARLIEEKGSEATQTRVTVGGVDIDIRGGSGRIRSLRVANPEQFSDEAAVSFGEFQIRMDPTAVTSDPIVIGEVTVNDARILMEQTTGGNNLRALQEALGRQSTDEADAGGPQLVIERFSLGESRVQVRATQLDESREVTIPQIVLTDIGRASNGATASEVAKQVLDPVIRHALESAAAAGAENAVRDRIDATKDRLTDELRDRLEGDDDDREE